MVRKKILAQHRVAACRMPKPTVRRRSVARLPAAPPVTAPSPGRANLFRLAHAVWVVVAVLAVGVFLASISGYSIAFQGQNPFTPGTAPSSGFFVFSGLALMAMASVSFALAFLLFQRRRHDRMALFVSFYVLIYGVVMAGPLEYLNPLDSGCAGRHRVVDLAGVLHRAYSVVGDLVSEAALSHPGRSGSSPCPWSPSASVC